MLSSLETETVPILVFDFLCDELRPQNQGMMLPQCSVLNRVCKCVHPCVCVCVVGNVNDFRVLLVCNDAFRQN